MGLCSASAGPGRPSFYGLHCQSLQCFPWTYLIGHVSAQLLADPNHDESFLLFAPGPSLPDNSVSSALTMNLCLFFFFFSGSFIELEAEKAQRIDLEELCFNLPILPLDIRAKPDMYL